MSGRVRPGHEPGRPPSPSSGPPLKAPASLPRISTPSESAKWLRATSLPGKGWKDACQPSEHTHSDGLNSSWPCKEHCPTQLDRRQNSAQSWRGPAPGQWWKEPWASPSQDSAASGGKQAVCSEEGPSGGEGTLTAGLHGEPAAGCESHHCEGLENQPGEPS